MTRRFSTISREISKFDIALAVLLSLVGLLLMYQNTLPQGTIEEGAAGNKTFLLLPLFLAVTIPVAWRRTAPLGALAVSVGALLINIAIVPDVVRCGVAFPTMLLLVFSVAARLDWRGSFAGLALALAGGAGVALSDPVLGGLSDVAFISPIILVVWAIGLLVRSRGRLAEKLRDRTSELQTARDDRARLEVATDRARISTELDQLLQRRLGELAALADQGPANGDADITSARLVAIENDSRETLDQMRELVGALRQEPGADATSPQPTLTHLDALVVRAKGADSGLRVEGDPRTLPAGVELSAYRIVEHLLGAVEDRDVEVAVRFDDEALELTVAGPHRRGAASAVERARERVQLEHGTLETTTSDGRASLRALLPMLAPQPATN